VKELLKSIYIRQNLKLLQKNKLHSFYGPQYRFEGLFLVNQLNLCIVMRHCSNDAPSQAYTPRGARRLGSAHSVPNVKTWIEDVWRPTIHTFCVSPVTVYSE